MNCVDGMVFEETNSGVNCSDLFRALERANTSPFIHLITPVQVLNLRDSPFRGILDYIKV